MNILVLAPHPDDETLGCGGTLCHHVSRGERVSAVFLTSGELGLKQLPREQAQATREAEARQAAKLLGLGGLVFLRCSDWMLGDEKRRAAQLLRPILHQQKPELIYLPHPKDSHPDHQATLPILRQALRRAAFPAPRLRFYEIWSPLPAFDVVQDITPFMARKLKAFRAHRSQFREFNYARAITGLNQYRGVLAARCRFAEVFAEASTAAPPRTL